jgi:mannose-6-phosphate isomerase-like protein (cupin superfamily)
MRRPPVCRSKKTRTPQGCQFPFAANSIAAPGLLKRLSRPICGQKIKFRTVQGCAINLFMRYFRFLAIAACGTALFIFGWAGGVAHGEAEASRRLRTQVVTWDEAKSHSDKWGEMRTYFTGETYGTTNLLAAIAVVKPGESVHPAHRHSEEEFLAIAEGTGVWHVNGKEFPAGKGDVLYVQPWDFHGVVNTGSEPLTFLVLRWNTKGIAPVPAPPGDNGR